MKSDDIDRLLSEFDAWLCGFEMAKEIGSRHSIFVRVQEALSKYHEILLNGEPS